MSTIHHTWTSDKQGDIVCKWCRRAKTVDTMGAICPVAEKDYKLSIPVTLSALDNIQEVMGGKIKAIKALRDATPKALDGGLKKTKGYVEDVLAGREVIVRVKTPETLRERLETQGIRVTWQNTPPEMSLAAQKVLEALAKKPDLKDELKAYFLWEFSSPAG